MLFIRTGLQGHGKTLNTIKEVDLSAKAQDRPVYFHNVTDLKPDKLQAQWYHFDDPHLWYELPENSIIVVDEAQGWFGVRDPRKDVPRYASEFEIMRKKGHEVHLITQDPRFIDVHVRRLCNKHIHYWRIFGSAKLSRYEMERCVNEVEKLASNKEATRTFPTLDKRYFGVYTSAKAGHHFSFKPSKKAMMFGAAALVAVVLCWRAYERIWSPKPADATTVEAPSKTLQQSVSDAAKSLMPSVVPDPAKPVTKADFIAQNKPRIAGVPSTAPVYDDLTKPKSVPKLYCATSSDPRLVERQGSGMSVGYIDGRVSVCQCYTQQGTRVSSEFDFCAAVARTGYFDSSIPDRSTAQVGGEAYRPQQPAQIAGAAQLQAASSQGGLSQPRVAVVPYEKAKFLW